MPNSRSGSSNEDNAIESTGPEGAPGCSQLLVPVKSQENELIESVKAEIGEAREENERLKRTLERMEKDYQSLQVRFFDILRDEASRRSTDSSSIMTDVEDSSKELSLCLGMCPAQSKKDKEKGMKDAEFAGEDGELDTKLQLSAEVNTSSPRLSPETRFQEQKDEDETWNPGKIRKIGENGESDSSPQAQAKRARVCVRARCDTPTMNDGCQWRKYGQKIAKGNPCPRAYYRCTVAPACPVRKQVQRCAEDLSILITTYEGTHNHPLSVTATAMASTTAAAASMLLSGSSTSQTSLGAPATFSGFNGLNFSIYDNSRNRQFYLPNAPSPFHPTITIDLTTPQMNHLNTNRTFSSNFLTRPKFPPPNSLSFPPASDQNNLPTPWGNYASQQNPYRSYAASNQQVDHRAASSEQSLTETLTKVLTTDPSIQSVIAAAISSMVAGNKTQEASTNNMHKGSLPLLRSPFPFSVADIASKSTLNKDSSS